MEGVVGRMLAGGDNTRNIILMNEEPQSAQRTQRRKLCALCVLCG